VIEAIIRLFDKSNTEKRKKGERNEEAHRYTDSTFYSGVGRWWSSDTISLLLPVCFGGGSITDPDRGCQF
jgi:hypothetical protein